MSMMVSLLADASSAISGGATAACGTSCGSADLGAIFKTITNTLLFLVGSLSVIMIIFGGLRYVISRGDSKNVESAKQTIIYAVAGVVVSIVAYAIVAFVTKHIK
jgi:hypothetical protein